MRDLPLNALRAFALVCAHQGLRPAARELGISHSALSRHVAELERWSGTALTDKRRRRLTLTPAGEALGKAALAALKDLERAAAAVREARTPGSVVISTTASFAARWLLPRLSRLESAEPAIAVSVLVDSRPADLESSEVDLAIRMGRGPWRDADSELLMDEVLYPVASAPYWKRFGAPTSPSALTRLRLLHDRDPHTGWDLWRRAHGPATLDIRVGPRFASSDLVLRAAAHGHGVALARSRLVGDDLASGALIRLFAPREVPIGPAYWMLFPPHGRSRQSTATVAAWLREERGGARF